MTWTKLSDDFSDDCWTLSDAAYRLHTEALLWNNRKLLDCVIPRDELRRFAKRPEAVEELLAVGYWRRAGDAFVIVHHAAYQRTKEAVLKQQAANARNGAKGGRPPATPREQAGDIKSKPVTDSATQSLIESPTERDRTGLASTGRHLEPDENRNRVEAEQGEGPPSGAPSGADQAAFCHGCAQKLDDWSRGSVVGHCLTCSGTCPRCGTASGDLGACSVAGCTGTVTEHTRREYGQVCFHHWDVLA